MLRRTKEPEDEETSQAGGFRTHGGHHAELKALADLPKVPECPFEMINGLIVFVESPQEVAFKGDDTSTTLARQCIICLDPSDRLLSLMCTLRAWKAEYSVVEHANTIGRADGGIILIRRS